MCAPNQLSEITHLSSFLIIKIVGNIDITICYLMSFNYYHNLAHTVAKTYDMKTNNANTKIILTAYITLPRAN